MKLLPPAKIFTQDAIKQNVLLRLLKAQTTNALTSSEGHEPTAALWIQNVK